MRRQPERRDAEETRPRKKPRRRGIRGIVAGARRHARMAPGNSDSSALRDRLAFAGRLGAGLLILAVRHLLPGAVLVGGRRALANVAAELPALVEGLAAKAGALARPLGKAAIVLKKGGPWVAKAGWKWLALVVKSVWFVPGLAVAVLLSTLFWLRRRARLAVEAAAEAAGRAGPAG